MENSKILIVSEDSVVSDLLTVLIKQNGFNNIVVCRAIEEELSAAVDGFYKYIFFDSRWISSDEYEEICKKIQELSEDAPAIIEITDNEGSELSFAVLKLPLDSVGLLESVDFSQL